jgi:membrane-associated protease RseP (regulator of RpoE activity)
MHWVWMTRHLPYGLRVVLLVFLAAWVALIVHELAHAVTARLLGVRVWSITLGTGPMLLQVKLGGCRFRVALFPLHGEVRLHDQDAERLGYRGIYSGGCRFEWRLRDSWRAPLITMAGSAANLLIAASIVAYWTFLPRLIPPLFALSACCFVVNCVMFLNLVPIRGLDGWRMAVHLAAWRQASLGAG